MNKSIIKYIKDLLEIKPRTNIYSFIKRESTDPFSIKLCVALIGASKVLYGWIIQP